MKEPFQIEVMNELIKEATMNVMEELFEEEILPLVKYRADLEKQIGNKEINDLYKLEEGL